jgi:hypothetical protein
MRGNGPYEGFIVKREKDPEDDPECRDMDVIGRVKVRIPGFISESAWAWPRHAGGARLFGRNHVPPIGALVNVYMIDGDPDKLQWECGHHTKDQVFPEFESADVTVEGDENFRFVHDRREGQRSAVFKVLKPNLDGEPTEVMELRFDIEGNGLRIYAMTGLVLETAGNMELTAAGEVKIQDRVVSKKNGMI